MSSILSTVAGAVASTGAQHVLTKLPMGSTPYIPYEPEGLTLLIQLGILANYDGTMPSGTLIGFAEHEIVYYAPHLFQGVVRRADGAGSTDLGHLPRSLAKCVQRISSPDDPNETEDQIKVIVNFAIKGLEELRKTYEVHKANESRKCFNVSTAINDSIKVLRDSIEGEVDHSTDTPIDTAVRLSYREEGYIPYIAKKIKRLLKPESQNELKRSYVEQLISIKKSMLIEYQEIKKRIS